jgi:hypothetical protein
MTGLRGSIGSRLEGLLRRLDLLVDGQRDRRVVLLLRQ